MYSGYSETEIPKKGYFRIILNKAYFSLLIKLQKAWDYNCFNGLGLRLLWLVYSRTINSC
jgi:hypothetical protein